MKTPLLATLFLLLTTSCATTTTHVKQPQGTYNGQCIFDEGSALLFSDSTVTIQDDYTLRITTKNGAIITLSGPFGSCKAEKNEEVKATTGQLVSSDILLPEHPTNNQLLILMGCRPTLWHVYRLRLRILSVLYSSSS